MLLCEKGDQHTSSWMRLAILSLSTPSRCFGTIFAAYSAPDARSMARCTLPKDPTPSNSFLVNASAKLPGSAALSMLSVAEKHWGLLRALLPPVLLDIFRSTKSRAACCRVALWAGPVRVESAITAPGRAGEGCAALEAGCVGHPSHRSC